MNGLNVRSSVYDSMWLLLPAVHTPYHRVGGQLEVLVMVDAGRPERVDARRGCHSRRSVGPQGRFDDVEGLPGVSAGGQPLDDRHFDVLQAQIGLRRREQPEYRQRMHVLG
ncbi:hypothetical protein M2284_001523 [Rhodococcus sp. LBL1]|uniref:Uncharacterized protein n=1 Tax=Prescottella agglutinans TaxID=1644129 RepID=A0ABT6MJ58_9NOCA|nr:hypothetical protein [Prescottella agglutinans]MDH6677325.1 hypothetical protein [Rhodococcus sp. LBL1]MDH6682381.1 hypothetical protein [Rhodococcus sp. LBL2]